MIPYTKEANAEAENETDIQEADINDLYNEELKSHLKWYDHVLLNRPLKVILVTLLLAIAAPALMYQFLFFTSIEHAPNDGFSLGSCVVPRVSRLPCGLGNVTQEECHPLCCYDLNSHACFHRYPSRFSYIIDRYIWKEWSEEVIMYPRVLNVPFSYQNSTPRLRLSIDEVSSSHMSLYFYNAETMSYEGNKIEHKNYTHHVDTPEMTVTVEGSQGLIFSTIRGPFIASRDIWEIAFKLTNETMYGIGELPLTAGTVKVLYRHRGDFSTIPLIFAKMNDSYHGLLIDSDAPTEVFVHEENQVVLRSITNEGLKLHVFVGPKPSDVMRDAMTVIGVNKQLDYWMLGAHICSDSATAPDEALSDLRAFMSSAASASLPFDSHCGSAPIVFDSDCEGNQLVEEAAAVVKTAGKRFVPQVSPYIRYHELNETSEKNETSNETEMLTTNESCKDIISEYKQYILHDNSTEGNYTSDVYVGLIGEETFVYPIFENASNEFMKELWPYEVEVDGVILENNWPLDESVKSNETSLHLPYFSKNLEQVFEITPKWNAEYYNDTTKYFYKHNKYGSHVVSAFKNLFETEVPMWSTSSWMDGNVNINRQNIHASWTNLRKELVEAALGGVSGHWLWSVPVCGDSNTFDPETQTSLCVKWYMAATYMPLIKIHSSSIPTHPLAFTGTNRNLMLRALKKRLSLLPYFYTTLQSGPLLRPMFYQFPSSEHLKDLNTQFSVGDDLVIVPNLLPSQTHVHFWIPPGVWYELWGGLRIEGEEGDVVSMTTIEADFLTFIRGGAVLILQKDVTTSAEDTRMSADFSLTIALDCETNHTLSQSSSVDSNCLAAGTLYISRKLSLVFEADEQQLNIKAIGHFEEMCGDNAKVAHLIKDISIYGLDDEYNNYDHHRQVMVSIDLCDLQNATEIMYPFIFENNVSK
ncbi:alpha-glucosidase 2-like [Leguminivora glycinivorella]|uniref:alpha-glucosidase 2-like n=1 Tax=Leguminivora glycinivorella TaxID=1035111 RepID=UPI002010AB38|nr:alpha-glucosidase 2-like [Leguminivora glycinivorella]